jgi:serine/threonine protein kinase
VRLHAQYFEAEARYKRTVELGKGKFSTVYLAQSQEMGEEDLAMKLIDKKSLTRKERDFLRDEI